MPSMDSNSSFYSSSGSSTSSLSSPRVLITDIVQQQQQPPKQLPIRIHTTTATNPSTHSHVCVTRYKTELCRPFTETGKCKYGDKCQFSHGIKELRILNRHPKYKTEYCRTFHTTGYCPYGPRCHFIHDTNEARTAIHSTDSNPRRHSEIRSNQSPTQKPTQRNRFHSDYVNESEQSTNSPFSFEDLNQALLSYETGDVFGQEQQPQTYPSIFSPLTDTFTCRTFSSSSSSDRSLTPQYI